MPSAIPDRFKLELRLGRDEDVEEWLATDTSLDRPVLVRTLGPETSIARREQFIASIGAVAGVAHTHLAKVFMVEQVEGGAYGVFEWTGGSNLADHIKADRNLALAEFLPNASGLAGALAALHEHGVAHGAIDLSAISYSSAHPAKLGSLGRVPRTGPEGDVRALASTLETALTGLPPGGPPPSERIDGVSPVIDRILRAAQAGEMDASEMENSLAAAPTPRTPEPRLGTRKLLYAALALVTVAVGLIVVGLLLTGESTEPVLPTRPTSTTVTTSPPTTTTSRPAGRVGILSVMAFDPYGDTPADDPSTQAAIDGDPETYWTTEAFPAPLPTIKPGLGLVLSVSGVSERIELLDMTPGTSLELRWASTPNPNPDDWEIIARARSAPGTTMISLPPRTDGHWLIWLTDLPEDGAGNYRSTTAEVRFLP